MTTNLIAELKSTQPGKDVVGFIRTDTSSDGELHLSVMPTGSTTWEAFTNLASLPTKDEFGHNTVETSFLKSNMLRHDLRHAINVDMVAHETLAKETHATLMHIMDSIRDINHHLQIIHDYANAVILRMTGNGKPCMPYALTDAHDAKKKYAIAIDGTHEGNAGEFALARKHGDSVNLDYMRDSMCIEDPLSLTETPIKLIPLDAHGNHIANQASPIRGMNISKIYDTKDRTLEFDVRGAIDDIVIVKRPSTLSVSQLEMLEHLIRSCLNAKVIASFIHGDFDTLNQ